MWPTPQETEEILNGKLYIFCVVKDKKDDDISKNSQNSRYRKIYSAKQGIST